MYYHSINGVQSDSISIADRGLAYGDGVFTTAKVVQGKIQFLSEHLERLTTNCHKLSISVPDIDKIKGEVKAVAQRFELCVAKIIITAGEGGRGYSRQGCEKSTVIISFHAFPEHYLTWQQQGINLGLAKFKLGISPLLSGIKHLNRLEQVLIRQELDKRNEDDLLVLNCAENIIEASAANIFWFKNNTWYTPKIVESGISGLMRHHVLDTLNNDKKKSVEIIEAKITILDNIEAMFICNSVMNIVPVSHFQEKKLALAPSRLVVNRIQESLSD
ncbi:MAG: aminodeoxychorismate lyase [Colwellia sp.]|nr:aminodeoxychorismate lyase [Colwellia sp.]